MCVAECFMCVFSVYEPCVLMRGVVHVRGTDVYAAHRAARGRRIPSCRSWRSWGWTLAAGWSDAPSHRTGRTPPWRCCDPNTSHAFATLPAGSGTTPGKHTTKHKNIQNHTWKIRSSDPELMFCLGSIRMWNNIHVCLIFSLNVQKRCDHSAQSKWTFKLQSQI